VQLGKGRYCLAFFAFWNRLLPANQHYRADIEGLRAVAVVLVMLYHYQFPGVSGGFIGVDVFFVISGFVITQLLDRGLASGRFSFNTFYARRIRRLVPVFLVVSTATLLLISPFYLDDDYYVFAKSWLASLVGLSNFYYHAELSQYFAPEAQSLSLLHTWSLAVEEQFYLLWPATFYLSYRLWRGARGPWLFAVLWAATLALSVYLAASAPSAAYYLLPARIFELLLGAGVALFATRLPAPGRWSAEALALAGITLVVATALLLESGDHFPGYNALWPTLGTALVIYTGLHHPQTLTGRLLGTGPMVFIGGISYSLYLWHWPPVALLHYQLVELTWPIRLGLVAAVLLLSWLSYRYVENRYRYRDWSLKKSALIFLLLPLLVIWAIQSTIRLADDISFRIPAERRELYRIIDQNNAADHYKSCFKADPSHFDQSAACLFGAPVVDGQPNSVLIGDSHATALIGLVEALLEDTELSLLLITRASTPFVPAPLANKVFEDPEQVARNLALSHYLSQRPMTVFVSAWWNSYLRNPAFHGYFLDTLAWLLERGHRVILLEDVPELPSAAHAHCLLKNRVDCAIDAAPVYQRLANFNSFKAAARERFPQVLWINPRQLICDEAQCQTVVDGLPLYRDESHLNYSGSLELGRRYVERFGNPLLREWD